MAKFVAHPALHFINRAFSGKVLFKPLVGEGQVIRMAEHYPGVDRDRLKLFKAVADERGPLGSDDQLSCLDIPLPVSGLCSFQSHVECLILSFKGMKLFFESNMFC